MTQTGVAAGAMQLPSSEPSSVQLQFTPTSLDVRTELVLATGRRRAFEGLLHIGTWWPDRVRVGAAIAFEPRVGGRFFENCDDGCGVLLGHLSRLVVPEDFAIEGSLGMGGPIAALWSVTLDANGHESTLLHGRLQAFGAIDEQTRTGVAARWGAIYAAFAHYLDA